MQSKITTREKLIKLREQLKAQGKKVVFTSGSFDLLHPGHVEYLNKAKSLGDVLIVALNSDASVRKYKDPLRPIVPEADRATVISALQCVDHVFIFDETNNNKSVELLKPDIYAKAGDYDKSKLTSAPIVEKHGGSIALIPLTPGYSTSGLIDRILARFSGNTAVAKELPPAKPAPAIFLDRDGTIIEHVDYIADPKKVKLIPGALEGIKKLKAAGFRLVITTNQPGIGNGYNTREDFFAVNREFLKHLSRDGITIDKIFFCPHSVAEKCDCRKPEKGMAERAVRELNVILEQSYVIGDTTTDLQFAKNIGCHAVLVHTGQAGKDKSFNINPELSARNLDEAADLILARKK